MQHNNLIITDPENQVTNFEYDKNGNLDSVSYPNGKGANYSYNTVDRLTGINYTGDSTTWNFQYDNNGNRTIETKNGWETTSYAYDNRNRVQRVDYPSSLFSEYYYNPVGQVTSITNSPLSNPVQYEYDPSGVNVKVSMGSAEDYNAAFMYDEQGRLKKTFVEEKNMMQYMTYRTYDAAGNLIRLRTEDKEGNVLQDYSYTYDKNGNRDIAKNEITKNYVDYDYDSLNQLEIEKYHVWDAPSGTYYVNKTMGYQYDLLGNRTQKSVDGNITSYSYNAANEITGDGTNSYTHDANGNMTYDGQYTYVYDAENQLIQVKQGSTVIANYEYNADGLRTKKQLMVRQKNITTTAPSRYIGSSFPIFCSVSSSLLYSPLKLNLASCLTRAFVSPVSVSSFKKPSGNASL